MPGHTAATRAPSVDRAPAARRTGRPPEETFPEAARAALLECAALMDDTSRRRLIRVMLAEPALTARWLAAGRQGQDRLVPVIASRVAADESALQPRLLAGLLVNASTTAVEYWAEHEDAGALDAVTAQAFEAAVRALGAA
ncbi:hypothetical protein JIX56_46305 [Streptomyces sp. CA-210063]|uniref:acyl-CoA-like ligand-binding transcription factor n=1 Tax=Streptomyces sp. CA-210063 TaxID=2801029 RepID=UPI00214B9239|nr:hypothetical protein [Streptomyces sp. CA-210063]UUU36637.1 hypothetical protein JIX56_46305 [Streptomyces sp. CA-210063]